MHSAGNAIRATLNVGVAKDARDSLSGLDLSTGGIPAVSPAASATARAGALGMNPGGGISPVSFQKREGENSLSRNSYI